MLFRSGLAFERFSRDDRGRDGGAGAGLGLAIVEAIARAHGGEAHAANRPTGGADVWVVLPAVAGEKWTPAANRSTDILPAEL